MRDIQIVVTVFVGLLALACAEQRPTRPEPFREIPAIALSEPLIHEHSASLQSEPGVKDSIQLCFTDEPIFKQGRVDDILVYLESDLQLRSSGLFVLNAATGQRHVVHGALPGLYGICTDRCFDWANELLSQVDGTAPSDFLDSQGCLVATAENAWNFRARLIDYNPSYQFVTVRTQEMGWEGCNSLTIIDDTLWHYQLLWDTTTNSSVDSLVGYLCDGSRAIEFALPNRLTRQAAFDGHRVWAYVGDMTISVYDRFGHSAGMFHYPLPRALLTHIAWSNQTLWVTRQYRDANLAWVWYIDEVDADSSLGSGEAVIKRSIGPLDAPVQGLGADSGRIVLSVQPGEIEQASEIRIFNLNGVLGWSRGAPVSKIESLALDGYTIWTLHHGALGAQTQGTLLSRFLLE